MALRINRIVYTFSFFYFLTLNSNFVSWCWIVNISRDTKFIEHKQFHLLKSFNLFDFSGPLNPSNLHRSTFDWNSVRSSVHSPKSLSHYEFNGMNTLLFNGINKKISRTTMCGIDTKRKEGTNTEQDKYFHFIKQQMSLLDFFFLIKKEKKKKKRIRIHTLSIRYDSSDDWPWKSNHMTSASHQLLSN